MIVLLTAACAAAHNRSSVCMYAFVSLSEIPTYKYSDHYMRKRRVRSGVVDKHVDSRLRPQH